MLRAAIFSAVSSAKQAKDDKISLSLQQETCKAKANVWLREFFKVAIDEDGNAQIFLR